MRGNQAGAPDRSRPPGERHPHQPRRPELGNGPLEDEMDAALETLTALRARDLRHRVKNVAGGYQLSTNPRCSGAVERFREEGQAGAALERGPRGAGLRAPRPADARRNLPRARGELRRRGAEPPGTRPPRRGRHGPRPPGSPALLGVTDEFLAATSGSSTDDFPPLGSLVAPKGSPACTNALGQPHRRTRRNPVVRLQAFLARAGGHPSAARPKPRFSRAAWR